MNDRKKYFCPLPWTDISVLSNGEVRPCCYITVSAGNLLRQSFEEIWNGPVYREMREAFSQGQMPRVCRLENCRCSLYYEYLNNR